jgi:Integrase core domain
MQNGFVESFNGRLRDECLNEHVFTNLGEARRIMKNGGSTTTPIDRTRAGTTAAFGARRSYLDSVIFLSLEN